MSEEKLELVTDFDALKACDLVVVKDCGYCGMAHWALLLRLVTDGLARGAGGEFCEGTMWHTSDHSHGWTGCMCLAPVVVDQRRVYRVLVPGADEALDMSIARPTEEIARALLELAEQMR